MATREEKQAYVDGMARERGYVLDFHKVMAEHDFDALQAGFEAWREVTGAEGIEPSVEVFQGGSGSDE